MRQFYQSTYYFWIVTKGIFAIAGFISAVNNLGISDLTGPEKLANFIGVVYAILLAIDVINSLRGNYSKSLKYMAGAISVLLGVAILILPFITNVISIPLTVLFAAWIILLGFFDLLIIKRKSSETVDG
jgi:hypothetical protein